MPRISTPLFYQRSVNALLDQQSILSKTQLKISAGKQFLSPADDPIGASRLLNLKQQESETEQFQRNIGTAIYELSSEEVQLTNFINQLIKAKELTVAAGNGSLTGSNLQTVKEEIQGVLTQLVDIANTNVQGQYMFSGSKAVVKPIILDNAGVYQYKGDQLQRDAQVGPSIAVPVNDSGDSVFFRLNTENLNLSTVSGQVNLTNSATALSVSGSLSTLGANELQLNGINIAAAVTDGVSTTDALGSALALANTINATTSKHGVVATANPTVFDVTAGTYGAGVLAAGDFTINGQQITGDINVQVGATNTDKLVSLINAQSPSGVTASNNGGQLRLTASDGRNIQLVTDGATGSGVNFGNFDLTGGALDRVQRGRVTLNDHNSITIGGSTPADAGFTANVYNVTANSGTGVISTPYILESPPSGVSPSENYLVKFVTGTTYQIFRESDPTTPVTNFKTYAAGQKFSEAEVVDSVPATYTAGENIVVDGVHFSITGTPSINDTFTIDVEPVGNTNIFKSMQELISSIENYTSEPTRMSYNLGLALTNIEAAADRASEIRSQIGARLSLSENQEKSNDAFIFFAKQGISGIEDLDIVSAISDLVQQQLAFEAAQRSIVQIQRLSLFDFL